MNLYFWSLIITLSANSLYGAIIDNYVTNDRQPRRNLYRGNHKFKVPEYLNVSPDHYASTIFSTDSREPDGSFRYEYGTDNGIKVKQESTGYGANKVVRGGYSYVGTDNKVYTTNYIADRFGYRAYHGAHLPIQPDPIYDQTNFVNRPSQYLSSELLNLHHPPSPQNYQDLSQNAYYSHHGPPNYVNFITPKPHIQTPLSGSTAEALQPFAWTTSKPTYNNKYSAATYQ